MLVLRSVLEENLLYREKKYDEPTLECGTQQDFTGHLRNAMSATQEHVIIAVKATKQVT